MVQHDDHFFDHDKTNDGNRAKFYGPQSLYGGWRENLIFSRISQHLKRLIDPHKKRNRAGIHERYKRIEVNLKKRRVRVHALNVGPPQQHRQRAIAHTTPDYSKNTSRCTLHNVSYTI